MDQILVSVSDLTPLPCFCSGNQSLANIHILHTEMIFRNSDQRELSDGGAWGWEFILSHDLNTAITTGYCRTSLHALSDTDWLGDLMKCSSDVGHAMLLPMILIGLLSSDKADKRHREARTRLRDIEDAVIRGARKYTLPDGVTINIAAIGRELAHCHSRILWNQPTAHLEAIVGIREAAQAFRASLSDERRKLSGPVLGRFDRTMKTRLLFYEKRWKGIESFGNVTKHRLDVQRNAVRMLPIHPGTLNSTGFLSTNTYSCLALAVQRNSPKRQQTEPSDGDRPEAACPQEQAGVGSDERDISHRDDISPGGIPGSKNIISPPFSSSLHAPLAFSFCFR